MPKHEIGLADRGELNLDQSFLKKKIMHDMACSFHGYWQAKRYWIF